ncbi:hypothetical protein DPMN_000802 [Dreissena polymorpha]|uniref:Uncharacterized protein n=1 Tax=Dreissena polymorpha TaxID=45954 RepID=A0A9D4MIY9_DREPO|nr:hypothetical protein DPMN_000802 [Dreissena polymorpha]
MIRWRQNDMTIPLSPSYYRIVAIVLSHCRHRTIALSPSYYRTIALSPSGFKCVTTMTLTEYRSLDPSYARLSVQDCVPRAR